MKDVSFEGNKIIKNMLIRRNVLDLFRWKWYYDFFKNYFIIINDYFDKIKRLDILLLVNV